jgi:hypothetical protein
LFLAIKNVYAGKLETQHKVAEKNQIYCSSAQSKRELLKNNIMAASIMLVIQHNSGNFFFDHLSNSIVFSSTVLQFLTGVDSNSIVLK